MATMTVETSLWMDPRTGIFKLKRRIPTRYRAVSGRTGETVKISTGTADKKAAAKELPRVLAAWDAMVAEWERALNTVALTPDTAQAMAIAWAASPDAVFSPDLGGKTSDIFDQLELSELRTPESLAKMWDLVEGHSHEAVRLSSTGVTPETWPLLVRAMLPVVREAYLGHDLRQIGAGGLWDHLGVGTVTLPRRPHSPRRPPAWLPRWPPCPSTASMTPGRP